MPPLESKTTMSPTTLQGPESSPASGNVKRLVLFLHGVGADGNDLIGLADMMDLPDTQFLSPHAPFRFDMAPFGHQWFSLMDRDPARMLAGIQVAAPILDHYIDAQMERFSLTASQVALVGFSQGSMMSLYTAPRRTEPLAAVVALSGAMLGAESLADELQSRPPICLIHGVEDEVVPFAAMEMAQTALTTHGFRVEAHPRPGLGHGIDEVALNTATTFLKQQFGLA